MNTKIDATTDFFVLALEYGAIHPPALPAKCNPNVAL